MGIGDPGGEELIGGKQRFGAGALEDSRDRSEGIQGLGSGQKSSLSRGAVHGDLGNDNYLYRVLKGLGLIGALLMPPPLPRQQVRFAHKLPHRTPGHGATVGYRDAGRHRVTVSGRCPTASAPARPCR